MSTITAEVLLQQLQWRYATKQFDPARKIPFDTWAALEKALTLAPSSFGLQPWRFIVVTNAEVKQSLVPVSWGQTQPADCSHHVVFAARKAVNEKEIDRFLDSIMALRGGSKEALQGYGDVMRGFAERAAKEGWSKEWATRQVYIALGNFMASCAMLGIDACPMEGIAPDQYDRILGLENSDFSTVVACAVGYRAADDKYASLAKVRYSPDELIQRVE